VGFGRQAAPKMRATHLESGLGALIEESECRLGLEVSGGRLLRRSGPPILMSSRTLSEAIEFVMAAVREHGVELPARSRLDEMRRVFLDEDGRPTRTVDPDEPRLRIAQEALRDISLLEPIFETLVAVSVPDRTSKIKELLGDAVIPRAHQRSAAGRDLQAELFVAATCVKGGMGNVSLDEPDVRAELEGQQLGISVKRLKNASRLDDNLRKASAQIESSGLLGVVFVDIGVAFNRDSTALLAPSDAAFRPAHLERVQRIIREGEDVFVRRASAKGVGLVYVFDSIVRHVPKIGWGLATVHMPIEIPGVDQAPYANFKRAFARGIDRLQEREDDDERRA